MAQVVCWEWVRAVFGLGADAAHENAKRCPQITQIAQKRRYSGKRQTTGTPVARLLTVRRVRACTHAVVRHTVVHVSICVRAEHAPYFGKKRRQPPVAPLRDVMRVTRHDRPRQSRHASNLLPPDPASSQFRILSPEPPRNSPAWELGVRVSPCPAVPVEDSGPLGFLGRPASRALRARTPPDT